MPVHPQVRRLLEAAAKSGLPPYSEMTPDEARHQMSVTTVVLGKPPEVHSVEDRMAPGPGGEIPIRIYRPAGQQLPIVVFFHGGGWVIGDIDTHDGYCRRLANEASAIVVSVDYRLAPEHRQPAAAEDCYAATVWAHENAEAIGGRADSLHVAGDSAGGNLAAVVALMARDRSGPAIATQVLIYPITDHDFETPSYREFATGHMLTRDTMIWFWDLYCPDKSARDHCYLSPLRADDLTGLPPALVQLAECDPLCSEGEAYAKRLTEANVDVTLTHYEGLIHGFIRRFDALDPAHDAVREVAAAINIP